MALKVKKDGFVYETVTPATRDSEAVVVRRQVFAGQLVPDHFDVSDVDVDEHNAPNRVGVDEPGYRGQPKSAGIGPVREQTKQQASQAKSAKG